MSSKKNDKQPSKDMMDVFNEQVSIEQLREDLLRFEDFEYNSADDRQALDFMYNKPIDRTQELDFDPS